jgi:radical SAM-linked protein
VKARLRYTKLGKIRYTSHRDVARMWERAFRRINLPLAYSQGFNPRPKVSFGLALPTGHESVAEYLDVDLDPDKAADIDIDSLPELLTPALPVGIDVLAIAALDDHALSLQHEVTSCSWEIVCHPGSAGELTELVARALAADSLVVTRERKGQEVTDDLRPALLSVAVLGPAEGGVQLAAELATQPRGVRPAELLLALDPGLQEVSARRTHQWIQRDGARDEPLVLDAPDAPHTPLVGCAS